jgi:hypothetical protein
MRSSLLQKLIVSQLVMILSDLYRNFGFVRVRECRQSVLRLLNADHPLPPHSSESVTTYTQPPTATFSAVIPRRCLAVISTAFSLTNVDK